MTRMGSELTKITCQYVGTVDNNTYTGSGVDMSGFEGVIFVACVKGGEAIANTLKAQQATASNFSDAADLKGTAVDCSTTASADGLAILDIYRPRERYVRPVLVAGNYTNAPAAAIWAIQYGARSLPVTQVIANFEKHVSPEEGTA